MSVRNYDEVPTGSMAAGHLELTDRHGNVWVPIRRETVTRFGKRDTPITHAQHFPAYRDLREQYGPLTVAIGGDYGARYGDRLCLAFDADGRTCGYGRGHSIQTHMLTAPWAEPGPDNPAVYVTDDQLDEHGGYDDSEVHR